MTAAEQSLPNEDDIFEFRAPYLEEKLLKERVCETPEEARAAFEEVKKYLLLSYSGQTHNYSMWSRKVDEVWHQFVLFTAEYNRFCRRYFGRYVHHAPSNAPKHHASEELPEATRAEFKEAYEQRFGPLPAIWDDAESLTLRSRIICDRMDLLAVTIDGDRAELRAEGEQGARVLVRVDSWAEPALRFLVTHDVFHVRELPGVLVGEDKLALCKKLVKYARIFRYAP